MGILMKQKLNRSFLAQKKKRELGAFYYGEPFDTCVLLQKSFASY